MPKAKKVKKSGKKEKTKTTKKSAKPVQREVIKQFSPKPLFHATCASCGNGCDLPFKPTGERPVYCPTCFQSKKNTNLNRPQFRPNQSDRKMYSATCAKCNKRCEVPFFPAPGKTVFCNECFGSQRQNRFNNANRDMSKGSNMNRISNQDNSQFATLNSKLDKIISALNALNAALTTPPKTIKTKKK